LHVHPTSSLRRLALGTIVAGTLLATACGGDDGGHAPTTTVAATAAASSTATAAAPQLVEIAASDFAYGGLPATVPAGTPFRIVNTSTTELHEFVLLRLADAETRSADELVHGDLEATLSSGPPALVILAPPAGADQIVAVGDGTLTAPGRYLVICMIPTGADPQEYLEAAAASNGAPPQVAGGAPHAMNGMYAEVTVV
jgi:hypothetical protein